MPDRRGIAPQSILASSAGTRAGTVGHLAATSFYPTKNLGAIGDGGAILSHRDEYAAAARTLRDYGQTRKYQHDCAGYNSRLDELQAAIMQHAYLPKLGKWTERRRQVAEKYIQGIRHPGIGFCCSRRRNQRPCGIFFPCR